MPDDIIHKIVPSALTKRLMATVGAENFLKVETTPQVAGEIDLPNITDRSFAEAIREFIDRPEVTSDLRSRVLTIASALQTMTPEEATDRKPEIDRTINDMAQTVGTAATRSIMSIVVRRPMSYTATAGYR